ncbi:MAG: ABC transporter permease [Sporichthyaceae bacterium]
MGRLRAIVSRRRILALLISRDMKVKYSDSALGYLWTVLDPLLMGGVYWFVFTVIFDRGKDIAGEPYIIYLLAALLPWQWSSSVISGSTRAISGEARLIRSVDVPREMWVLRTVGSKFVEFVFSIPVLVLFVVLLSQQVHLELLWVPVAIALQGVTLMGVALILAPAAVMLPDVERLVRVINPVLFYFCPIIYGAFAVLDSTLPGFVKEIYSWNPFTTIIGYYRAGLFPGEVPDLEVALRGFTSAFVLLAIGVWVFRKLEPAVLKEI